LTQCQPGFDWSRHITARYVQLTYVFRNDRETIFRNLQAQIEFASVTISFFIHATEDKERLVGEISKALSLDPSEFSFESLEGHYGNPLTKAKAHIIGERAKGLSRKIIDSLSSASKQDLLSSIEKHVDEHGDLYLRLDRQSLRHGLSLGDDEPVRIKLKLRFGSRRLGETVEEYRRMIKS
jgi:RNA-binding protein